MPWRRTDGDAYSGLEVSQCPESLEVRVETEIIYADEKCAYFSQALFMGSQRHGEVLVKMKFKKGPVTFPPGALIDSRFAAKPPYLQTWDDALEAM